MHRQSLVQMPKASSPRVGLTGSNNLFVARGLNPQGGAAMQQIADWLEKLGLGQYAPCFVENDISFAILSDLTDQDLKEIGVPSLGHRRQLLRAIAELNSAE